MKKIMSIFLFFALIFVLSCKKDTIVNYKEYGWNLQTTNTNLDLISLSFIDSLNGWAVGGYNDPVDSSVNKGEVYFTNDAGKTWQTISTSNNDYYFSVFFLNKNKGWVCGAKSRISTTVDGGKTWKVQYDTQGEAFQSIRFADDLHGWVCDLSGNIYYSSDGGESWIKQEYIEKDHLLIIKTLSKDIAYVIGGHQELIVDSQGRFISYKDVGKIYKTSDGGMNWSNIVLDSSIQELSYYKCAHFIDENNGWACGSNGVIISTTNSGKNWKIQNSGYRYTLNSIYFSDKDHGWACGSPLNNIATILTTTDGGNTWVNQTSPSNDRNLLCLEFANNKKGWCCGNDGTMLVTENGGLDIK